MAVTDFLSVIFDPGLWVNVGGGGGAVVIKLIYPSYPAHNCSGQML